MRSKLILSVLMFFLPCFAHGILPDPTTAPFNVYLSPQGSDANSGLIQTSPIQSLTQAQVILKAKNPQQNVIVNILPGTYYNQSVTWSYVRPEYSITFQGVGTTKPIFDGCASGTTCTANTFFILKAATGQPSNVRINNLQIQRYWMGISLNGDYKNFASYNWNNTISNNLFQDIGNIYNLTLPFSYAAVRLYNSRNNQITGNVFRNIVNVSPFGAYIHAVYAASWASSNLITGNTFENVSGDVVRVRDTSNYNRIENNTFKQSGLYAELSDWYCSGSDCDKYECPSWENVFGSNTYGLNFQLKTVRTTYASGSNVVTGCSAPTLNSPRISSQNNVFLLQ